MLCITPICIHIFYYAIVVSILFSIILIQPQYIPYNPYGQGSDIGCSRSGGVRSADSCVNYNFFLELMLLLLLFLFFFL